MTEAMTINSKQGSKLKVLCLLPWMKAMGLFNAPQLKQTQSPFNRDGWYLSRNPDGGSPSSWFQYKGTAWEYDPAEFCAKLARLSFVPVDRAKEAALRMLITHNLVAHEAVVIVSDNAFHREVRELSIYALRRRKGGKDHDRDRRPIP